MPWLWFIFNKYLSTFINFKSFYQIIIIYFFIKINFIMKIHNMKSLNICKNLTSINLTRNEIFFTKFLLMRLKVLRKCFSSDYNGFTWLFLDIFHNRVILFSTKWTVRFYFLDLFQANWTDTHMSARKKYALAFVSQTNWTVLILIIHFKKVLWTINVIDSKR